MTKEEIKRFREGQKMVAMSEILNDLKECLERGGIVNMSFESSLDDAIRHGFSNVSISKYEIGVELFNKVVIQAIDTIMKDLDKKFNNL